MGIAAVVVGYVSEERPMLEIAAEPGVTGAPGGTARGAPAGRLEAGVSPCRATGQPPVVSAA